MATSVSATRLSVGPFTAPQRQRLEALTAAVELFGRPRMEDVHRYLDIAEYIETGER